MSGDALVAYLRAGYELPFVWGRHDCASWVCDWVLQRRGVDPWAPVRGTYCTRLGGARLLRREHGLLALASRCFAAAGITVTQDVRPGDVGCIRVAGSAPALAIMAMGGRWAWKCDMGVVMISQHVTVLRAWRV